MTTLSDLDRSIAGWLIAEAPDRAPDRLLEQSRERIRMTTQRRAWWPERVVPDTDRYRVLLIAATAVVVAVVGLYLAPTDWGGLGGPGASPSPSVSPSPSPDEPVWPWGAAFQAGMRQDAILNQVPFSFVVPASGWGSPRLVGMIEIGTYPTSDYAYVSFDMDDTALRVFTDPCQHVIGPPVGRSVAALADAMTTIPDTDAVGPLDVTVGGRPAKLVELTIHDDIACEPREFALYGVAEDSWWYLNSVDSIIRDWILEVDGKRVVIHSDQTGPDDELAREIQEIVDSIVFE